MPIKVCIVKAIVFPVVVYGCAETPILWPPDVKRRLIRKDPDAGKE